MKLINMEGTYACQLNKPANRIILEHFATDKDKDVKKFSRLFLWLIATLRGTPAWNKPKTNYKIREIKDKLEATLAGAKRGTSSGYAVAGDLIRIINYCRYADAEFSQAPRVNPGVPSDLEQFEAELEKMLTVVAA